MCAYWIKFLLAGFLLSFSTGTMANDDIYIDDRSKPQFLIASYFNALNRHEFARAWSYWDHEMEQTTFEDFVEIYTDVTLINFRLGKHITEGAAGSTYYYVPIVIGYDVDDVPADVMSGCFLLKISQPSIQSPPFSPLHIENGFLDLIEDTSFADAEPGECVN